MADISTALKHYLSSLVDRRWHPGAMDCGVFMADWVLAVTGRDPIADVRGTYSTQEEFELILEREGGFLRSCAARLTNVGFVRTKVPNVGDIAIVKAPYAVHAGGVLRRPTGALCVTDKLRAVMTSDLGLVIAGNDALPLVRAFRHG